ncbi:MULTISPECIES: glycosyltransferase family 9 protein [unclassified Serratia (in: enterobacteria)]|uniref:glycosyltransferase family 9 protein n=1 Tax=unclassified Serratia (in: enterobacteria) TaxID=2647522 RepID=UPI0005084DD1|nr:MULTISPECIES: glycosyltransferase family 9 protein [unclassified Serratia (in: enterobacteria)]KFK94423.1 glycosyl transferase [Serratia sp. Ag2]KFK99452.1 glycosyl transferase [Serratia sp. Ag1]
MKVLLIRRENIGDLILTTPLIAMLAKEYQVDVLVNSYNMPVLDGNPRVSNIYHYTKSHHEASLKAKIGALVHRLKTTFQIWRAGYDVAIIAGNWNKRALSWARISRAKRIITIGEDAPAIVTDRLPYIRQQMHLVEELVQLAKPLNCESQPGKLELYLNPVEIAEAAKRIGNQNGLPVYGLQISSRKANQRWPVEHFIELAHRLSKRERCKIILFWSPGSSDNPLHPGDDEKADLVVRSCSDIDLVPYRTNNIRELMAGMALCDQIVTSDGGALHIAAGVGKPVIALFGTNEGYHWGPWQVPSRVLEAMDNHVNNLSTDQVYENFIDLRSEVLSLKNAG